MSFAAAVERARTDFTRTPRLELTMPQAVRLWGIGIDDCRVVVDALIDAGFLAWTARRTLVRRGPGAAPARTRARPRADDIGVGPTAKYDNAVGF